MCIGRYVVISCLAFNLCSMEENIRSDVYTVGHTIEQLIGSKLQSKSNKHKSEVEALIEEARAAIADCKKAKLEYKILAQDSSLILKNRIMQICTKLIPVALYTYFGFFILQMHNEYCAQQGATHLHQLLCNF